MHGGGFLAMSSRSMQIYTRRWARKLGIPVFSIDYRMPPEHRFPSAPYDCLRVYEFLVNHIHKYMNVRPEKIILAGDSAGGNLVFSLNALIMKNKLPMPHALYAAYPALDLRKQFSPSKMFAFTDPLLYPSMLLLCLSEYLGESR
jgi:hormone-sensitive lipase